jgi:hypothetical protein
MYKLGRYEMFINNFSWKAEGKIHLGDLSLDGKILVK